MSNPNWLDEIRETIFCDGSAMLDWTSSELKDKRPFTAHDRARLLLAVAILRDALDKIDVATRWREVDQQVNFCADDCPRECNEHNFTQKRKTKSLCNGDIAREALAAVAALGENEKLKGEKGESE